MQDYFEYYGPDYRLHITPSNMENLNDRKYLEFVSQRLFEVLDRVEAAPGVAINTGASGDSRTALQGPPDQRMDVDGADVRRPDTRVRDEGALGVWGGGWVWREERGAVARREASDSYDARVEGGQRAAEQRQSIP